MVGAVGLLLHGLNTLGITFYRNNNELRSLQVSVMEHKMELKKLNDVYHEIVTRISFNDYINHADIERDKQNDINQKVASQLGFLKGEISKCTG